MKQYVIVSGDFTTYGGMDCANYYLARYLAEQVNTTVHIVAFHVESHLAEHPNVRWHRARKLLRSYTLSESLLDRAGRAVARQLPDARVIVNGGNCNWGDVNWVHYVHAAWTLETTGSAPLRMRRALQHRHHLRRERRIIPRASLVIANSDLTRDDLLRYLRIDPSRIVKVYYGTDGSLFRPGEARERESNRRALQIDPDVPLLAFVGALGDRRKGFDLLFEAWQALQNDRRWDAKLLVIGQGAELARWQSRAERYGLSKSIRFLGFRSDVSDILKACDALVAPSRYEAYGLSAHEAICCGLPALVSAGSGVAERYPAELRSRFVIAEPLTGESVAERLLDWRVHIKERASDILDLSRQLRAVSWDDISRQIVERIDATIDATEPARRLIGTTG